MVMLVLRRLVISVPLVIAVSAVMFVLVSLTPGDPALQILGANATPASIEALREQLGLDKPLLQQYWEWLVGVLQGNFGKSIYSGQSVVRLIGDRLPATASLIVLSGAMIAIAGGALGLLSAIRGGWFGRFLDVVSLAGLALPSFWVAIMLVATFAVALRWLPATGYVPFERAPLDWLLALVLPVISLSLVGVTMVAKQMRDSATDVLDRDYIRVLRANGLSERSILFKHVLRNAAAPSMTILGLGMVAALAGSVFVENVFVIPGLGTLVTSAALNSDVTVVLGVGVYFTFAVILINLVVDISYGLLNPKVRVS